MIDNGWDEVVSCNTKSLTVTSLGAITIFNEWNVYDTADIEGRVTILEWENDDGTYEKGILRIYKDATLYLAEDAIITTSDSGKAEVYAEPGSKIYIDSVPLSVTADGKTVTFDGTQKGAYELRYIDSWSIREVYAIKSELLLPDDLQSFRYTVEEFYRNRSEGDPDIPVFDKITFTSSCTVDEPVYAKEIVIPEGVTVTLVNGYSKYLDGNWYYHASLLRSYKKITIAGTVILTESPQTTYLRDDWGHLMGEDEAGNIFTVDDPALAKTDVQCLEMVGVANISGTVRAEGNAHIGLNGWITLNVTGNGRIIATKDSFLWSGNGGDIFFTKPWPEPRLEINAANEQSITAEIGMWLDPGTIIRVGNDYFTIPEVTSGNKWDSAKHSNMKLNGSDNANSSIYINFDPTGWIVKDTENIWWGAPFDNECRVFFDEGAVEVNGNAISTNDFITFTQDEAITFEFFPPEAYTGEPVVTVNGGYYAAGGNNKTYRSDDYKDSDLWYDRVEPIKLLNNSFDITSSPNKPLAVRVYWDHDDIMLQTLRDLEAKYAWNGEKDNTAGT
ncbi:MAG: hypothetical protein K6G81_04235 [Lachnospiraceae bacterium]|nr:hypothetical protein [Lachnospiraceae bacterium]